MLRMPNPIARTIHPSRKGRSRRNGAAGTSQGHAVHDPSLEANCEHHRFTRAPMDRISLPTAEPYRPGSVIICTLNSSSVGS
jgi:hypothetical protein